MPTTELGKLTDKGIPTRQAYDRLEAAIFAKAYNNDKLISLFSQAKDAEGKLIISALAQVAPQMARLDGAGSLDIRDIVTDGVIAILNAKSRGLTLQQAASQMDIEMSPDSRIIINLFATNVRSNKAAVKALREAANFAYQEAFKPTEDMFGAIQKSSREDVLEKIRSGYEKPSTENVAATKGAGTVAANAEGSAAQPGAATVSGETEENRSGSSLELKGETEAEIRAKEAKAKEAAAKAKSEAEKADAERKAEAERKEIAERSKTAEFDLTPTDQVDKDKQAAIDKKAAEDELAGQKDIFGGEKKEELPYTPEQRQNAQDSADDVGGEVVWQRGDYALVRGYSVLTGDAIFIPVIGTQRARVDISVFTGKKISPEVKQEMIEAKEKIEAEAEEKHKKTPFITFDTS
jgi:hypothetical protein